MNRRSLIFAAASIALFAGCESGSSTGGLNAEATYVVDLTTAEVVPAPKPSSATGAAAFIVRSDRIEYQIAAQLIPGVTAVHVHSGVPGVVGTSVVTLFTSNPPVSPIGTFATGTMLESNLPAGVTLASVKALLASGSAYVDIHTTANTSGELRGQID